MSMPDVDRIDKVKPALTKSSLLVVDYSIAPSLIDLKIKSHPKRKNIVKYDISRIERVLVFKQGDRISGYENLERLKATGKILLDVRVMEEFLKSPKLISKEWKRGINYFWNTLFHDPIRTSYGYVAYFYWNNFVWMHNYCRLDRIFGINDFAICYANR